MSTLSLQHSVDKWHALTHALGTLLTHRAPVVQAIDMPRRLPRGATFWVPNPRASFVRCLQGTLWLTVDGCQKDLILEVGESYAPDSKNPLAIHALTDSQFVLS